MIQIHNSLTGRKEDFHPINPGEVRLYVCGMTVYDFCHIGHARVLVVFDMIYRYFKYQGYDITYVRNITDIDDKIIKRANENGEPYQQLTARFIKKMHEDSEALGVLPPDIEPKATETIAEMLEMIATLIDKGHAYVSENGDVLYSIESFSEYGKLANQNLSELQAGQRVEVDESKQNPLDFVLWKAAKPEEPHWDSPWGKGRPGWHIECSAMSKLCLGEHFDIHGGGLDLKFPHHECEVAQSEPVCGGKHVNYWIHNGFVQVDEEKMSKSLGNFFTIRDVLAKYPGEVIRFFILNTHYRSPLNYSTSTLDDAGNALSRLYNALLDIETIDVDSSGLRVEFPDFFAALDDDFNTSKALSELFALAKQINKSTDEEQIRYLASALKALAGVLGLLQDQPEAFLKGGLGVGSEAAEIEQLIAQRNNARANKDFATADSIRAQLATMGVEIEDKAGVTTWRKK